MTLQIDLLKYQDQLRFKSEAGQKYLFDILRQKWLVAQPEELVRQLMVQYLMKEKAFSKNRITIEKGIIVNDLNKRYDLLIYDKEVTPLMLIECKSPKIKIKQDVFDQIGNYNALLKVKFLVVTNGIDSYCCLIDHQEKAYRFLEEIPSGN